MATNIKAISLIGEYALIIAPLFAPNPVLSSDRFFTITLAARGLEEHLWNIIIELFIWLFCSTAFGTALKNAWFWQWINYRSCFSWSLLSSCHHSPSKTIPLQYSITTAASATISVAIANIDACCPHLPSLSLMPPLSDRLNKVMHTTTLQQDWISTATLRHRTPLIRISDNQENYHCICHLALSLVPHKNK